jgi:hypothetical protein
VRRPQARATSTVFPARDADRAKKASEAPADPGAMTAKLPQHRDGAEARGFPSPPRRTASRAERAETAPGCRWDCRARERHPSENRSLRPLGEGSGPHGCQDAREDFRRTSSSVKLHLGLIAVSSAATRGNSMDRSEPSNAFVAVIVLAISLASPRQPMPSAIAAATSSTRLWPVGTAIPLVGRMDCQ